TFILPKSRRLGLHQYDPLYGSGAFLRRATSASEPSVVSRQAWRAERRQPPGEQRRRQVSAGVQGFEPCQAALETACSPRSTLLSKIQESGIRSQESEREKDSVLTPDP